VWEGETEVRRSLNGVEGCRAADVTKLCGIFCIHDRLLEDISVDMDPEGEVVDEAEKAVVPNLSVRFRFPSELSITDSEAVATIA